jgi:magnesium transporter
MLLDLKFSIGTLGLATGTLFSALYGMNLKNFIEESDLGFWGISGISAAASVFVIMYGVGRLRRVQRVSMWGAHSAPAPASRMMLGTAPQDATLKELQAELRNEERSGLWGLGRKTVAQAERIRRLNERVKEQSHHPQGPLWAKTYASRQMPRKEPETQ